MPSRRQPATLPSMGGNQAAERGSATPILYRVGRIVARAAVPVYFKRVEVLGGEHLPREGPAVLAANHPQSITDALILGWAVSRPLHFLAHGGLFRSPVVGRVLRLAGVLPVHRSQDAGGAGTRNLETFGACRAALEAGRALAIYPEGVSLASRRLQPLKTGAARIALEAEEANAFRLGVRVVPVGITFETRTRFRTRVLVRIGVPLEAASYSDRYARDPRDAVHALTEALREGLSSLIVDLRRDELESLVADLEATYREDLLARAGRSGSPPGSSFARAEALSREIARAVEYYTLRRPELVWRVGRQLRTYQSRLEELRVSDRVLRGDDALTRRRAAAALVASAAVGLPFAAYGALWNALPYKLTGRVAKRRASDETKLHWHQLTWGAVFYGVYYPPLLLAAWWVLGPAGAAVFGATLVPTGFFARWYGGHLARRRESLRFARLLATERLRVQELRRRRRRLTAEIDAVVSEYLSARDRDPNAAASPGA